VILFLTYDGLTDPLGSSQIVPYLRRLSQQHRIHILSFEKEPRAPHQPAMRALLQAQNIGWTPLRFTRNKLADWARMLAWGAYLKRRHRVRLLHCRSYVAAAVGMAIQQQARLLFDMRGFWVDERVEGGNWRPHTLRYRLFKRLERRLLRRSDHLISLTQKAVPTLRQWVADPQKPITVIPCCADFEHFRPDPEQRARARRQLGYQDDHLVISYHGSLGTWYLFDDMLAFFRQLHGQRPNARLLLLTPDTHQVPTDNPHITARSATRQEMPLLLQASDLSLSFIRASFSKQASSPTKMAEALALGLPCILNRGVGDSDILCQLLQAGLALDELTPAAYQQAIDRLDSLLNLDPQEIRERARPHLSLDRAAQLYAGVYEELLR